MQIPRSAIIEESGVSTVFVVTGDVVEKRTIQTGYAEGGFIEVVDGLDDDDEIVFVGHTNLKDGSNVSVISTGETARLNAKSDPSLDGTTS
jgi:multidrug efflux pump subunit AcrA (membrane-fusion protein)